MKHFGKTSLTPLILSIATILLSACIHDEEENVTSTSASLVNVGDAVPEFVLTGSDGKVYSSSSLDNQIYILNFFDTGCPDCQEELQVLQRIYDKYQDQVPVLNVPRSQSIDEVQTYWDQTDLTMPYYTASDKNLYYQFATKTIPRTYIINKEGKVTASFTDSPVADFETVDASLEQLLLDNEDGLVNLSFRLNVPASRANVKDFYFHNEYAISRLEIWFFDADTKEFITKSIVSDLKEQEPLYSAQYDISYLFDNVRIKALKYDIFLVANYDYSPDLVEDEMEFLNIVDTLTYKEGIIANMPESGPIMTNRATSLLNVDLAPWANKSYTITVDMERVVAKLEIGTSQNFFQLRNNNRLYAEINITNYKFVNMNKQYYLFQHIDRPSELGSQPEFTLPDYFADYTDDNGEYVVDPLFYNKTPNEADVAAIGDSYQSWFGSFTTENFASMPSANNFGLAYVLENTTFRTSQKNGYSPGVVFKAAVSPVFVYLYDVNQRVLKEEFRPEYWPNTLYLYRYNFYGSIQAINVASGLALDELVSYTDDQLKTYGIKQCKFNMGVYETFYTYWIRHRNNPSNPMGPMEYGIVRNNYYKMIVTGVNGVGSSSIIPEVMRDNYPNSYVDVVVD